MNKHNKKLISVTEPVIDVIRNIQTNALKEALLFLTNFIEKRLNRKLLVETNHTNETILLNLNSKIEKLNTLGLLENISSGFQQFPDEPFLYNATAHKYGYGHDLVSFESSVERAVAENVECTLWYESDDYYKGKTVYKSYKELGPSKAVNILSFVGFSDEQRKANKNLFYTENTKFRWIQAYSLINAQKKYCPLSLFSSKHITSTDEPELRWGISTGLSTGKTLIQAKLASLLEIVERDAFMITYLNTLTPPKIDLNEITTYDMDIDMLVKDFKRHSLEIHAVLLPTDFPVDIVLAVIIDKSGKGPALTVGACASFDIKHAIIHSFSEALAVRLSHKTTYNKPRDMSIIGLEERVHLWTQSKQLPKIEWLIAGETVEKTLSYKTKPSINQLKILTNSFKEKNYNVWSVTLSSKELHKLGYHSVMSFAPDMQPLHLDETIPYISGERLHEVPKKLGYTPAKVLNTEPHPFP